MAPEIDVRDLIQCLARAFFRQPSVPVGTNRQKPRHVLLAVFRKLADDGEFTRVGFADRFEPHGTRESFKADQAEGGTRVELLEATIPLQAERDDGILDPRSDFPEPTKMLERCVSAWGGRESL